MTITFENDYCEVCGPKQNQQFALEKKQFKNLTITLQKIDKLLRNKILIMRRINSHTVNSLPTRTSRFCFIRKILTCFLIKGAYRENPSGKKF